MSDIGKMKLQITMPMLERMLGGDTEMEVELRNGIANEFAEKHLRSIANDFFAQHQAKLSVEIGKAFADNINKEYLEVDRGSWRRHIKLTPKAVELIGDETNRAFREKIHEVAEEVFDENNIKGRLQVLMETKLNGMLSKIINKPENLEGINTYIKTMMEKQASELFAGMLKKLGVETTDD